MCYLAKVFREGHFSSFVYLSSARVYQGAESGREGGAPVADGLYSLIKLTGEALCLQTERGQVAQLSNIVGEGA